MYLALGAFALSFSVSALSLGSESSLLIKQGDLTSEATQFQAEIQDMFNDDTGHVYSVMKSSLPSMYEVHLTSGKTVLLSEDKTKLVVSINGGVEEIDLEKGINTTRRNKAYIANKFTSESEPLVSYQSKVGVNVLSVFADIQCTYCQSFQSIIPTLIEQGVTINIYPVPTYPHSNILMSAAHCSDTPEKTYSDYSSRISSIADKAQEQAKGDSGLYKQYKNNELIKLREEAKNILKGTDCRYDMNSAVENTQGIGIKGTPAFLFNSNVLILGNMGLEKILNQFAEIE